MVVVGFLSPVLQLPEMLWGFAIVLMVGFFHIVLSSNTVTGPILIPLLIGLAEDVGVHPWIVSAPAAFASSLAFILVTETPTNVIPYSSGYFGIWDMAKAGILMTIGAAFCVGVSLLIFG